MGLGFTLPVRLLQVPYGATRAPSKFEKGPLSVLHRFPWGSLRVLSIRLGRVRVLIMVPIMVLRVPLGFLEPSLDGT